MYQLRKRIFTLALFVAMAGSALAVDNNQTLRPADAQRLEFNMAPATNSTNPLVMKPADWENLSKKQGVDESMTGSAQDFARKAFGKTSLNADLSKINNNYLNTATEYDSKRSSISAYSTEMQTAILNSASASSTGASADNKQVKCYITRDIPFRYKCSMTGLIYGGGMNESGAKAKNLCNSECYETKTCLNVSPATASATTATIPNLMSYVDGNTTVGTSTFIADSTRKIKTIAFTSSSDNAVSPFYINLFYKDAKNIERKLVSSLMATSASEERLFSLNDTVKSIYFKVYSKTGVTANVKLSNIIVTYSSNEKWICPSLQDISKQNPADFAKLCPSGQIYTFVAGSTYKICADSAIIGENTDGTFATQTSCLTSCKASGSCTPDTEVFNTEILKNFREGCIQGQSNCVDADCATARKTSSAVMNEVFFDAGYTPIISVQNSIQVKDVKRPRVSVLEDADYLKQQAEEWKDEAYAGMLKEKTFTLTSVKIGENTVTSNAFGIGNVSGGAFGVTNTSTRALKWNYKPAAYDVSTGQSFFLYSVMIADIGHQEFDLTGKPSIQRDRIWYIKTGPSADQFKSFRREVDIGASGIDNNASSGVSLYLHPYVSIEDTTFSGGAWHSISSSSNAEYFDTQIFNPELKPFWTRDVIHNLGTVLETLPGLVRYRTKDIYRTSFYDGKFDGSGDGLLDLRVISFYSNSILTYKQITDRVLDKTYPVIYQSNAQFLYPTRVKSDSENDISSPIHIYQYGAASKQTAYMRAFPRKQDIGKKGFVYVFVY